MNRLVVATVFACAGCAHLSPDSPAGSSHSPPPDNWIVNQGVVQLNFENRLFAVLMTAGGQPTALTGGNNTASGKIKRVDGAELLWTCDTADGVTGVITFGSQKFRLEDGGVILVDLRGGKFRVEQAVADMSHFEGGDINDRLKSEAITDERLARFLQTCNSRY